MAPHEQLAEGAGEGRWLWAPEPLRISALGQPLQKGSGGWQRIPDDYGRGPWSSNSWEKFMLRKYSRARPY